MEKYKLGFNDPEVRFDNGVGHWRSVQPKNSEIMYAENFIMQARYELVNSWLAQFFTPNAVENLQHFLGNTGEVLKFNEKAFMGSLYCAKLLEDEVWDAKNFCRRLKPGGHYKITSTYARHGDLKNAPPLTSILPGNLNIFYSLGGFRYWGKAEVDITLLDKNDTLYSMIFTFTLKDRYNWNPGLGVNINGTVWSDVNFGYLNLYGMAQDFDIIGVYTHKYTWRIHDTNKPNKQFYPVPLRDYFE